VNYGSSQTYTITPNAGYYVADVKVDGKSKGAVSAYTFNFISANHTIEATFSTAAAHTIIASAGAGGSISPSGTTTVNLNSSQTYTISPASGYHVTNVLVDNQSVGAVSTYTFSNITTDHTISASFANTYTLTVTSSGSGTVTSSGGINCGASCGLRMRRARW
jgi:hypothetical protein